MPMRLSRIIVFVADTLECAAFYRDTFGLEPVGNWTSEWAVLACGGSELAFHQACGAKGKRAKATGSPDDPHKIVFYAKDVESERSKLLKRGVKMGKLFQFEEDGRAIAFCDGSDPEGHRFQISSR